MAEEAPSWTVGRLLEWTKDYFTQQGIESARLDAEVLLAEARGCKRIELYTVFDEVPDDPTRVKFKSLVRERAAGKPVAYLVGRKEFYSLEFAVTPDVLIPRPETELLVLTALDALKRLGASEPAVADVGAGSGAISVAVATQSPAARVTAIDVSPAALAVAHQNAERHAVLDRLTLVESDLFAAVDPAVGFDLIVSNPPYVTTNELVSLDPTVRDFEPLLALDGGPEGTDVIQRLLTQASERLADRGELLIEIGPAIAGRVEALVGATSGLVFVETHKDLAGLPRVVHAKKA